MSHRVTTGTSHGRTWIRIFARCAWLFAAALFLAQLAAPSPGKESEPQFTSKEFLEPIKFLASDKLKGRGDGTKELDEAADYIAKRFRKYGLKPVSKNKLYVGGTGTPPGFKKLVEDADRDVGFDLSYSASGYGASDHMSFTVRSVPVLFFFSGLHSDYHKPSETWVKINAEDGAKVVRLVA